MLWSAAYLVAAQQQRVSRGLKRGLAGTPDAYEADCAAELRQAGWSAKIVGRSGDQGADVIARMGGITLVVQCKAWRKPVGNSAVQEAHAARTYYRADFAAVVTEAGFTRSAEDLARKTGVLMVRKAALREVSGRLGVDERPTLLQWVIGLLRS